MEEIVKPQSRLDILINTVRNYRNKLNIILFIALFASLIPTVYFVNVYTSGKKITTKADAEAVASTGNLQMIGHAVLKNRGMNSALAIYNNYVYVGSRTDGSHPNSEVMVVDKTDPTALRVVGRIIDPPAVKGATSRELRVWPDKNILIVLYFACSSGLHACKDASINGGPQYRFFDISGANATNPKLITSFASYSHEFFLWDDPINAGRALIFASTIGGIQVIDISGVLDKSIKELLSWRTYAGGGLHSLSISTNGTRAYVANLSGGFYILDTSDFANKSINPEIRLVTDPNNRVKFGFDGAHSAVKVPGKDLVVATEEVYGSLIQHGCPWGWMRVMDISNQVAPALIGEYKISQNYESFCNNLSPTRNRLSSFATHNLTLTPNLALVSWHSGGLRIVSLSNPRNPVEVARFIPTPLVSVVTEDPMLSSGVDKVVFWSYPVISNGIIYVVDIRNGLYALRYTGPFQDEINNTKFLEGNSNRGNANLFEDPKTSKFAVPSTIQFPKGINEVIVHNHDIHD